MTTSVLESTLGSLVSEKSSRAIIFEQYGLDYCCGGNQSLAFACEKKGVDPAKVLKAMIDGDEAKAEVDSTDWRTASLTELADHIEGTHHAYLRREFPLLAGLTERVVKAHSDRHAELPEVAETLKGLESELMQHMMKEEQILFPLIRQMESNGQATSHCGSIANPINVMEYEHANAGNALAQLQKLTNGYKAPEDACASYKAMLLSMADLEQDLHVHIHKENSILFPRAIALEEKLAKV